MSDSQPTPPHHMEEAVARVIDQVVKIEMPERGTGSGLLVPGDRILTCLHVIDGAPGIVVRFRSGEGIIADVVALDHHADLALLSLRRSPSSLEPDRLDAVLFEPDQLDLGEPLVAIGHPLDLDWAVTGGHFNAVRQPGDEALRSFGIDLEVPLVQVDVAINPGNSGGPLIDIDGRLVGIADSVINPALANNIGFAIAAPAVIAFWQAHQDATDPLTAYSCHHHHSPDLDYCPATGKPVEPVTGLKKADNIAYTCGHRHAPGLVYCPDTGKPVAPASGIQSDTAPPAGEQTVSCTNCGLSYLASSGYCPHCGKPQRS